MKGNFGFIHDKIEIKIFILFVLRRMPEPVTLDLLTELAMCDDGISYFDFTECVSELVSTEHVQLLGGMYSLTEKGARNGKITENSLPYSVRKEAESKAISLRTIQSRNAMINTVHRKEQTGGYRVELSLSDGVGEIVKIELFAANEDQAMSLEKSFRKNAESIYNKLIEMILS